MSCRGFSPLHRLAGFTLVGLGLVAACSPDTTESVSANHTEVEIPLEGTCEAEAMRNLVNEADFETLDDAVGLDRRAAERIIEQRPFDTLEQIDDVSYVGIRAMQRIFIYAAEHGYLAAACEVEPDAVEIGIISDLDKTVIPPGEPDLSAAPYPGVTRLYQILELGAEGAKAAGDIAFVTARQPESVTEVPAYLEEHGLPTGVIETGVSGLPWVAGPEKVRDIEAVFGRRDASQRFVFFGDSSHVDAAAFQEIRANYPERFIAGFIHKVNNTVDPARVEGLYLHEGYIEVAAILYGLEVLTRDEALEVMVSARDEGEAITDEEMAALLDAQDAHEE